MVLNQKITYRVFLILLVVAFLLVFYFVFFYDSSDEVVEDTLKSLGFESADGSENTPAVPLPSDQMNSNVLNGGSGGGSGASGSSGGGTGNENNPGNAPLRFCTFETDHVINGDVPCRCGLSAVCTEVGQNCDATFNEGQGACE